ncbi:MAG: four helix bundle protein [Bacteroidota bacterium]
MKKLSEKKDPLRTKTLQFAIRIVNLAKYLRNKKKEFLISNQIMRCGTNPGAMIREAAQAESGVDFIHKLAIAQKEANETQYWLELLYATHYISEQEFTSLHEDSIEILKLLTASIKTKKRNLNLK